MSKPKHHIRQELCSTRAPYRDGRKPTAIKVYTIHHESKYLLIQGVPSVGAHEQLVQLFEAYGDIEEHRILDDYPTEQFTEVYLIKYKKIQSARFAKKKLDDWSFYGGVLHVCFAPEYETVQETREKIVDRRRVVAAKSRQYKSDGTYSGILAQAASPQNKESAHEGKAFATSTFSGNTEGPEQDAVTVSEDSGAYNGQDSSEKCDSEHFGHGVVHSALVTNFYGDKSTVIAQDVPNMGYMSHYGSQGMSSGHILSHIAVSDSRKQQTAVNVNTSHSCVSQYNSETTTSAITISYGQEVVQQAHSLQMYGKPTSNDQNNTGANTGLKRIHDAENCAVDNSSNQKQSPNIANDEQLVLPPPPKQLKASCFVFRNSRKEGKRKVPSAQATFPQGFDARTDQGPNQFKHTEPSVETMNEHKNLQRTQTEITWEKRVVEEIQDKTMQEKIEENLKSKNPVIKPFNKATITRFIPRQAQMKTKTNNAEQIKPASDSNDALNKEIRKNALTLGKPQGPADLGPSAANEKLDPKEKFVIDSIQQIRKKMTQV